MEETDFTTSYNKPTSVPFFSRLKNKLTSTISKCT